MQVDEITTSQPNIVVFPDFEDMSGDEDIEDFDYDGEVMMKDGEGSALTEVMRDIISSNEAMMEDLQELGSAYEENVTLRSNVQVISKPDQDMGSKDGGILTKVPVLVGQVHDVMKGPYGHLASYGAGVVSG